jgi:hypothetical protein
VADALTEFVAAGCQVTNGFLSCRVTVPERDSDGAPHRDLLASVADVADVHLQFARPPTSFELSAAAGGALEFMADPAGEPSTAFEGDELAQARRAWAGDIEAALSLSGRWNGDLAVSLAAPLIAYDPGRGWRAVRTLDVFVQELAAYPWWRTGELVTDGTRGVIVAVVDDANVDVRTPSLVVLSIDRFQGRGPQAPGDAGKRQAVQRVTTAQVPVDLPVPEELEPSEGALGTPLVEALRPRCDAVAWAWLSNAMEVGTDEPGEFAALEYFGYRRRRFTVGPGGYTGAQGQRAYDLYLNATQEPSPDRDLAIRQVVSLHDGPNLPAEPNDVARAAEPLYQALRAGEVAAVLETQRQARSIAVDAARSAADAAQTAAKSATERTIASLAALAGIAVANATAVLSKADARAIAIGITGLFVFLVAWAIFVEGPTMRAPLNSFNKDLATIGYLLPQMDRTAILGMDALKTASNAVLRARIASPIVYATGAALTLLVAHSRFGLHL